jgi:hypothetical protein
MSVGIDYKQKYQELKAKYMESVDQAFRLGYEDGMKQATQDAAQQQMQQSMQPGMDEQGQQVDEQGNPIEGQPQDQSELDQHISQLESLLENKEANPEEIQKTLHSLKSFRKSQLEAIELKKSAQAIPEIAKNLHKPQFKMNVQASSNLSDSSKKAITMQHKIVSDIMSKWEKQEAEASKEIKKAISIEGLLKKE